MIAAELTELLKDSNVEESDRQTILRSLKALADKGGVTARLALDNSSPSLPGDFRNLSFAAVFEHCCQGGWGEKEFDLWNRWRAVPRNVLAGLDDSPSIRSLPRSCVDQKTLYHYCKAKNIPVAECHVFLTKLGEPPTTTIGSLTMPRSVSARARPFRTTAGICSSLSGTPNIYPTTIGPPSN